MTSDRDITNHSHNSGELPPISRRPATIRPFPVGRARPLPDLGPPATVPKTQPPPSPNVPRSTQGQPSTPPTRLRSTPAAQAIPGARAVVPPRSPHTPRPHRTAIPTPPPPLDEALPTRPAQSKLPKPRRGLFASWQWWVTLSSIAILSAGGFGAALLFKLPALPNCPSIFWPTASASLRLYCAQLASNKQTVDDLLEAIALVNTLPADHPMRDEVDRYIEQWSDDILELADTAYNRGNLAGAIAIANRIPTNTAAHDQVEDRITQWKTTWAKAEAIYEEAEQALLDQDPRKAFEIAVQLLEIGNRHWETTRYQELIDLITVSREDGNKLARIRRLARRGGLTNLLSAIELAQEIKRNSPAFPAAQRLISSLGRDMLKLAESMLQRRDLDQALDIVKKIPESANLQRDVQDFTILAQAQSQAWNGSISDLTAAIDQANRIRADRTLYGRAQELIGQWQLEIEDVQRLDRAQQFAQYGTMADLQAAIAEASLIPRRNPRGSEARELIQQWTREIETTQDRPILVQAEELAAAGDLGSLQAAVEVARQIRSGRALHDDAQARIADWQQRIQQIQAPFAVTSLPPSESAMTSRPLTPSLEPIQTVAADGQPRQVDGLRGQTEAQAQLQRAYTTASAGDPNSLLAAIQIADQIASTSPLRTEANQVINLWSQTVLQAAITMADYDLVGAIALAEGIPRQTDAYAKAQLQLQGWRQLTGQ